MNLRNFTFTMRSQTVPEAKHPMKAKASIYLGGRFICDAWGKDPEDAEGRCADILADALRGAIKL